jgi:acyl-coenzyme A thioesterase PaaI-like protein
MNVSIPDLWRRLSGLPGGRRLFSFLIGRFARYSGSIGARVRELEPGRSLLTLRDRPRVRNHLRSVHATALVTFGELASGLAMMAGLPPRSRAIVTGLEVEYMKKARGPLTAHGTSPIPAGTERQEYLATASIRDAAGDEVARVVVHWLVGPAASKVGP